MSGLRLPVHSVIASSLLFAATIFLCIFLIACEGNKDQGSLIAPPNITDPQWVEQSEPRAKVAVVFVHGLFGNTLGTWTGANGKTFFQHLTDSAQVGSKVDIFAFGFTSNMLDAGSLDIREASNKLHESLQFKGVNDYPVIVFVTHSMGGLVVLRHVISHPEIADRVPLILLYAAPQEGAQIATIANIVANNPALANMFPADRNIYLQQLSDDWGRLPRRPNVICGYEKLATNGVMIVPWTSATRFCDDAPAAIEGADHINIVKPDRAEHASVILLVNALNRYVMGKNFEARLETPDFLPDGDRVLLKMDSRQRRARLVNSGRMKLNFTIAEISDPALYIVPEDTPKEIPGQRTQDLTVSLLHGATAQAYRFILLSDMPSRQVVEVRVPDLVALSASRAQLNDKVAFALNEYLADSNNAQRLANAPPGDSRVLDETVQVVFDAVAKESPGLPVSSNWLLTADALTSANWPQLALTALRRAEMATPSLATTPSAQRLAGIVASQAGATRVFTTTQTPTVEPKPPEARRWLDSQQLNNSAKLATRLQTIPTLRGFGLSLEGDIHQFRGDPTAARKAYMSAASIERSPSISTRIMALELVGPAGKTEKNVTAGDKSGSFKDVAKKANAPVSKLDVTKKAIGGP
jgi:pimeloyl-ACP methyl ester carboxylesterase